MCSSQKLFTFFASVPVCVCVYTQAGESDGRVLLNFDTMKVATNGGDCEDSLEIRYNLPGQPGAR